MSYTPTDKELVADIVVAARHASSYVTGMTKENFMHDTLVQDAVIRRISIIGEAAGDLTAGFRDGYPAIPWRKIVGMRNIVVHAYNRVDLDEVWRVCDKELSVLIETLGPIVAADL